MAGWATIAQKFNELPSTHFCTKLLRMGGWVATEKLVIAAHPPIQTHIVLDGWMGKRSTKCEETPIQPSRHPSFWMAGWASEAQNVKKCPSSHPDIHRSGWLDGQAKHKM
jgi:ribosome modulation factor